MSEERTGVMVMKTRDIQNFNNINVKIFNRTEASDFKEDFFNQLSEIEIFTENSFEKLGYKTVRYFFDKYEISLILDANDRFIAINEVKLKKDFLSLKQKLSSLNSIDVSRYYIDNEEDE